MKKELTRAERYALLLYRQGKEVSRALPSRCYGDPENGVKFESEKEHQTRKESISAKEKKNFR